MARERWLPRWGTASPVLWGLPDLSCAQKQVVKWEAHAVAAVSSWVPGAVTVIGVHIARVLPCVGQHLYGRCLVTAIRDEYCTPCSTHPNLTQLHHCQSLVGRRHPVVSGLNVSGGVTLILCFSCLSPSCYADRKASVSPQTLLSCAVPVRHL